METLDFHTWIGLQSKNEHDRKTFTFKVEVTLPKRKTSKNNNATYVAFYYKSCDNNKNMMTNDSKNKIL